MFRLNAIKVKSKVLKPIAKVHDGLLDLNISIDLQVKKNNDKIIELNKQISKLSSENSQMIFVKKSNDVLVKTLGGFFAKEVN